MSHSKGPDRAQVVEDLHTAMTERLATMQSSDDWLKYLSTSRLFHRYSPRNQMLLAAQGAEGAVASYRNWQRIPAEGGGTCQVAKGQTGLFVLAPMKARSTEVDAHTGDEVTKHFLRGFRPVKVFHQGQLVAPPDIAPDSVMPKLLTGPNRWQHVWSAVKDHLEESGYEVSLHSRSPIEQWNGATDYSTNKVLIADDLEPPQQLKTLLHEWAHVQLDHRTRQDLPRPLREVEAESVAFLLGETIGLDSQVYSVPYIAGWSGGDTAVVQSTAEQVLATTKRLVETLEHELGIKLDVDVVDHALPETDSNVIALPGATPPDPTPTLTTTGMEQQSLLGPTPAVESPIDRADSSDAEFLRALGQDLEPAQADEFVKCIYRPDKAPDAARILAESGRTATQTARILDRFGIERDRINSALSSPVPVEGEPLPLYPDSEVDIAIVAITPADQVSPDRYQAAADTLRGEKVDDMKMLQRVLRTTHDPRLVAELAQALDLEPANVVRVCEHSDIAPSLALAVSVAVNNGNGPAALASLKEGWPHIEGGWESHAHPSMLATIARPTPVPDLPDSGTGLDHGPNAENGPVAEPDPMREMFAEWNRIKAGTPTPSPEPLSP